MRHAKSGGLIGLAVLFFLGGLMAFQNCAQGPLGAPKAARKLASSKTAATSSSTSTSSSTTSTTAVVGGQGGGGSSSTSTTSTSTTSRSSTSTSTSSSSTTSVSLSPLDYFEGGNNCVRGCENVFRIAEAGGYDDPSRWPSKCKAANGTMEEWNQGPGSQNWPVVCRSAEYMMTDNATWFTDFMRAQKNLHGHGGRELFSPLYSHHIIGPILGVLRESNRNQHSELENLTRDWLRAYWAVLSLGAIPRNQSSVTVRVAGQPTPMDNMNGFFTGLSIAIPGPRTNTASAGWSLMPPMLTFALDFVPRNWSKPMRVDTWFSHTLNFFLALDANLVNGELKPNNSSFPPEKFGLSSAERSLLKNFVNNHDPGAIPQIAGMIEPYFPFQPITFIRTSTGMFSYYGDSDRAPATNPNPNKCPFFIVTELNSGQYTAYHPHHLDKAGCPLGSSGRQGNQICATGHTVTDCAEITGSIIYEVVWRKNGTRGVVERLR